MSTDPQDIPKASAASSCTPGTSPSIRMRRRSQAARAAFLTENEIQLLPKIRLVRRGHAL